MDSHKIVLFDFIGAGNTDTADYDQTKYSNLKGYADDLLEVCHSLDLKNVIFIGHSVSCMIGVLASIKDPGVFKRLIMVGPSPYYINEGDYMGGFEKEDIDELLELMDEDFQAWARSMSPNIMRNPDRPELAEELADLLCASDPVIAKSFAKVTFLSDNREDLSRLSVESITLQCQEDIIAPLTVGTYIKNIAPLNQLVNLNATGHCPHMSQPEELIRVLKQYI